MSKTGYYIAATIGGIVGGFVGSLLDGGNFLGIWGIVGSLLGGLAGIFVAYKLQKSLS